MLRRIARPTLFALVLVLLAACGQPTPTTGDMAAPAVAPAKPPTTASIASTTTASQAPTASATQAALAISGPFAGIEQGTTSEGYHTLGSASAPVTLVMYSDFL